ncbi:hypothetical protein V6N13_136581 [Hibiscus sabdariffa]
MSGIPLVFTVRRCKPEFVTPAKPTPSEQKLLSDIDDQASLRFQVPLIFFYRQQPSMEGKHPAEADADVTLEQFGEALQPPFPCFDELLFNVPGSEGILNCPLLLIQVTRLKCGGFIFAIRLNHTMCDGPGLKQFVSSVAAMTRGEATHLIPPVWRRHLLDARDPPQVTCTHHEYDEVEASLPLDNLVQRSFFFGHAQVSLLRRLLPVHLRRCTKFELLTAFLWRCRSLAINLDPHGEVRMLCIVNARSKIEPLLPQGY